MTVAVLVLVGVWLIRRELRFEKARRQSIRARQESLKRMQELIGEQETALEASRTALERANTVRLGQIYDLSRRNRMLN